MGDAGRRHGVEVRKKKGMLEKWKGRGGGRTDGGGGKRKRLGRGEEKNRGRETEYGREMGGKEEGGGEKERRMSSSIENAGLERIKNFRSKHTLTQQYTHTNTQ